MKPSKEDFEAELAKLIGTYRIQAQSENIFLLCLAVVSFTAFACAIFLWSFLP